MLSRSRSTRSKKARNVSSKYTTINENPEDFKTLTNTRTDHEKTIVEDNKLATLDENKESTSFDKPTARITRTRTKKKGDSKDDESDKDRKVEIKTKKLKQDINSNRNSASVFIDYKDVINTQCVVQMSQRVDSIVHNDKIVENKSQLKKDDAPLNKTYDIETEKNSDNCNPNDLRENVASINTLANDEANKNSIFCNKQSKLLVSDLVPSTSATCREVGKKNNHVLFSLNIPFYLTFFQNL